MLYEEVRENLATWLGEASEVGRGLPRYVERDVSQVPGMRSAGARLRAGALRESCKDELLLAFSSEASKSG